MEASESLKFYGYFRPEKTAIFSGQSKNSKKTILWQEGFKGRCAVLMRRPGCIQRLGQE